MSSAKFVNIARLMTTYNFDIEHLPDNLKCAKCKLVLKDACLLTCSCTFCRICIDDMMSSGVEFCPGQSEDCEESLLSCFVSDFRANNNIAKLTVKCPNNGCVHECRLANVEEHLRECQRKSVECPFLQLGCKQDNLAAEEINGHLLHDNRRHSEILIGMVANINREVEILKQRDEDRKKEIGVLKHDLALKDDQIRTMMNQMIHLENENKSIAVKYNPLKEIEVLKHDLALKDDQIRTMMNQMIHLENENKSIAQGKEELADRVTILQDKIEREINERLESDELDMARVIEHVDREIAAITAVIGSNKDEMVTEMKSVKDDIQSINQGSQSMKDEICSIKSQVKLIQELVGPVDAKYEFEIVEDFSKVTWAGTAQAKTSDIFTGALHQYRYQLSTYNYSGSTGYFLIHLRIHSGPNDGQLAWPFDGRVDITVSDKDRRDVSKSISRQCRIARPGNNSYKPSDAFKFLHSELISARLDLSRGVHVSCFIVPGAGR